MKRINNDDYGNDNSKKTQHSPDELLLGRGEGMDDSQKLELVTMLIESVKPIQTNTLIDMPLDEEFPDMDKEL